MYQTLSFNKTGILWLFAFVAMTMAACHGKTSNQQKTVAKAQATVDTSDAPDEQMIEEQAHQSRSKPTDTAFRHPTKYLTHRPNYFSVRITQLYCNS